MESAIPTHLRTDSTRDKRIPGDYQPPYPSFVARHKRAVKAVVMAYFGVQFRAPDRQDGVAAQERIARAFAGPDGPGHWDRAAYVDEAGFENIVSVAYWDDPARFDVWFPAARDQWTGEKAAPSAVGTFVEVVRPAVDRYETLFSSLGRPEGVAALADGMSGEIQEHGYWGGMRDRIPLSQTDALSAAGAPRSAQEGGRVQVAPQQNLCLIRSGQDWTDTLAAERAMYVQDVEPVLREGMDFLRDHGRAIGCYANRYMTVLGAGGEPTEKTYGMSWWRGLADLERWAESHPTHVKIFGAAMKYLQSLGPAAKLRLYHEVTVATADEQFFEYLNCHDRTGLLRAQG